MLLPVSFMEITKKIFTTKDHLFLQKVHTVFQRRLLFGLLRFLENVMVLNAVAVYFLIMSLH